MTSFPDNDDEGRLLAREQAGDNAPSISVGDLSAALKRTVENAFDHVRVRGEISGWKRAASGHCYFTLKDENACIDAVLWKGQAARLAFSPEDGAEVVATGKLTTYPGRSKYQVVVQSLELAGEGALMALLEKRKRALAAEGIFAAERKRDLPYLPRVIGVVTSPTGAVIRDILHRLADRAPSHVIVWPVQVQGETAAAQVAAAIRGFDGIELGGTVPRPDLLIVARGGGSIEDLWAFNEEVVVRAADECSIPLISAVGHETDTTLIDHAADRRAPTPTAAAEMAVPVLAELRGWIDTLVERGGGALERVLDRAGERTRVVAERLPTPARMLDERTRRSGELAERLTRGLTARAADARGDLAGVGGRLDTSLLERRVREGTDRLEGLWRVAQLAHPDKPLERGYARVTSGERVITTAGEAKEAGAMTLHFADGTTDVVPSDAPAPPPRPVAKRRRAAYRHPDQGGLFDGPPSDEER